MSNPPDKLWTEEEKYFLLGEILKKAGISSACLFNIVKEHNISPNWMEIPLPPGRSVYACQAAFQRMEQEFATPQHRHSLPGSTAAQQPSPVSRKRPLFPLPLEKSASMPRLIQPKPPPGGVRYLAPEIHAQIQMAPGSESTAGDRPRKRGRPTKAEIERRTRMAQAGGTTYPPLKRTAQRKPIATESRPMGERVTLPPGIVPRPAEAQAQDTLPRGLGGTQAPPERPAEQPNETQPPLTSRQPTGMGTGILSTPTPSMGLATPRTIIEGPSSAPAPSMSIGPTFRGINQPSSVPVSPTPDIGPASSAGMVEGGGEPVPPVPGVGGGRQT